jgi:hypothetical protein
MLNHEPDIVWPETTFFGSLHLELLTMWWLNFKKQVDIKKQYSCPLGLGEFSSSSLSSLLSALSLWAW